MGEIEQHDRIGAAGARNVGERTPVGGKRGTRFERISLGQADRWAAFERLSPEESGGAEDQCATVG